MQSLVLQQLLKNDVKIATLAQDNAYGREGIAAFKAGAKKLGANIVNEQYADTNSTDFTANIQNIISSKPDYLFIVWAGKFTLETVERYECGSARY